MSGRCLGSSESSPGGVKLVDLFLHPLVCRRIAHETIHDAAQDRRSRVRPGEQRGEPVGGDDVSWRRDLLRPVFVALCDAFSDVKNMVGCVGGSLGSRRGLGTMSRRRIAGVSG